jgi:hypothetical protein
VHRKDAMPLLEDLHWSTWLGLAMVVGAALWMHLAFTRRVATMGATLLTTLGIGFCFLGIALGLLDFDANDIRASVPTLIDGIRTAFWVSVAGITAAITIKLRVFLLGDPPIPEGSAQAGHTLSDVAALLQKLHVAIAGTEDSALVSQTKLMRTDSNDRLDRLQRSFDRFAENMAEANSKALIKALSEVIRDFNTQLNEQFGDNFKQLNQAVEKLVTWQEQYRLQLTQLIEQETQTRKTMTEASLRYAELVNKSSAFTQVAESLSTLLAGLADQRAALETSLRALADLVATASKGLPVVEARIVEMTRQIESGVKANNDVLAATLKTVTQNVQSTQSQMVKLLNDGVTKANQEIHQNVKQLSEDTRRQVKALDVALEKELTRSIESLGQQLTALSRKFVEDYSPLTDRLRQLVQVAGRV